jgi:hypothetical protein
MCFDTPAPAACCGDLVCEGDELAGGCEVDCGVPDFCGDAVCNGDETACSCSADCGLPPGSESPGLTCSNGIDDDCDGFDDCSDSDCAGDAACICTAKGDSCSSDAECCSGKCRGRATARTCK